MIPFSTVTEKLLNGGGLFEMLLKHLFPPLRVKGKRREEEPDYATLGISTAPSVRTASWMVSTRGRYRSGSATTRWRRR